MKNYKMLTPGNKVRLSIKSLYWASRKSNFITDMGHEITNSIDGECDMYDLDNGVHPCACCDGEECEVKSVDGSVVTFVNRERLDEGPQEFKITIRECETAIFDLK